MAEFPALPLWTDAYLGDTTHLTTIEHGAYMLLLMVAWRSPGTRLPDDDAKLARFARMTGQQWLRVAPTIREFFDAENGWLTQSRLTDEAVLVRRRRDAQAEAGRASALKRKDRHSTKRGAKREQSYQRNGNEIQPPTPTSTPKVEETTSLLPEDDKSSLSTLQPTHVVEAWNLMADRFKLPAVRGKLSDVRKRKVAARIKDHPLEEWLEALAAIERSGFLRGENQSGWTATFDWMIEPRNFTKLIEGNYDRQR